MSFWCDYDLSHWGTSHPRAIDQSTINVVIVVSSIIVIVVIVICVIFLHAFRTAFSFWCDNIMSHRGTVFQPRAIADHRDVTCSGPPIPREE